MKQISAKASFSEKAKKLFTSETKTREVLAGVITVRSRDGVRTFRAGRFTVSTDKPAK